MDNQEFNLNNPSSCNVKTFQTENDAVFHASERGRFYATALEAGLSVVSDDKCCRLLVWCLVYGGANEQTVFDDRLYNTLVYAQHKIKAVGGGVPNDENIARIQEYNSTLTDFDNPPEWVLELEHEYGIKPNGRKKKA